MTHTVQVSILEPSTKQQKESMQDYDPTPPMPQTPWEVWELSKGDEEIEVDEIEQLALDDRQDDLDAIERHHEEYLYSVQEGR